MFSFYNSISSSKNKRDTEKEVSIVIYLQPHLYSTLCCLRVLSIYECVFKYGLDDDSRPTIDTDEGGLRL